MQSNQIPSKFPIPWANSAGAGFIRSIPTTSQIGIVNGAASLTDGFPPLTFTQEAAGGTPAFGQDMNGVLNEITAWSRWAAAGGQVSYDAPFSSSIGGYPKGALLQSSAGNSWWLSSVENNVTNPDAGGAGWMPIAPIISYAGNPNGNIAGVAGNSTGAAPSMVWDIPDKLIWICTTTGTSGTAVWSQLGLNVTTPPQFDDSTSIATTAFFKRAGFSFPNTQGIALTSSSALTASQAGQWAQVQANGVTTTLPILTSVPIGATFTFIVSASGFILKGNGTDNISNPMGVGNTYSPNNGEIFAVSSNGPASGWFVVEAGLCTPALNALLNLKAPLSSPLFTGPVSINRSAGEGDLFIGQNDGYFYGNPTKAGWYSPTHGTFDFNFAESNLEVNGNQVWHAGNITPVQQGTGVGQLTNAVKIGWDGTRTKITIDATDKGEIAMISDFTSSKAQNGYQKLPGGLILQWGFVGPFYSESAQSVTLPIAFPTAILNASATLYMPATTTLMDQWAQVYGLSLTSLGVFIQQSGSTTWPVYAYWQAIGY